MTAKQQVLQVPKVDTPTINYGSFLNQRTIFWNGLERIETRKDQEVPRRPWALDSNLESIPNKFYWKSATEISNIRFILANLPSSNFIYSKHITSKFQFGLSKFIQINSISWIEFSLINSSTRKLTMCTKDVKICFCD